MSTHTLQYRPPPTPRRGARTWYCGNCGKCYVQSGRKTSVVTVNAASVGIFIKYKGFVYITFIPKPNYYHHVYGTYICAVVKILIFHYRWKRKSKTPTTTRAATTTIITQKYKGYKFSCLRLYLFILRHSLTSSLTYRRRAEDFFFV